MIDKQDMRVLCSHMWSSVRKEDAWGWVLRKNVFVRSVLYVIPDFGLVKKAVNDHCDPSLCLGIEKLSSLCSSLSSLSLSLWYSRGGGKRRCMFAEYTE
jgi:hypothetical protein